MPSNLGGRHFGDPYHPAQDLTNGVYRKVEHEVGGTGRESAFNLASGLASISDADPVVTQAAEQPLAFPGPLPSIAVAVAPTRIPQSQRPAKSTHLVDLNTTDHLETQRATIPQRLAHPESSCTDSTVDQPLKPSTRTGSRTLVDLVDLPGKQSQANSPLSTTEPGAPRHENYRLHCRGLVSETPNIGTSCSSSISTELEGLTFLPVAQYNAEGIYISPYRRSSSQSGSCGGRGSGQALTDTEFATGNSSRARKSVPAEQASFLPPVAESACSSLKMQARKDRNSIASKLNTVGLPILSIVNPSRQSTGGDDSDDEGDVVVYGDPAGTAV